MSMRPGRYDERNNGRRRDRLVIYTGIAVSIVLLWTLLVLVLGVGSHGSGSAANDGAGAGKQSSAGGDTGQAAKGGITAPHPENNGGTLVHSDTLGGKPEAVRPTNPAKFIAQERVRDRKASGQPPLPKGGAVDEPSGRDPLGIKAKKIPLTPVDQDRVKAAAAKFVIDAYGYSGKDRNEYVKNLNRQIIPQTFYSSPGDTEIESYLQLIESRGTKSAAKLTGFEFGRVTDQEIPGYAYFSTADSYDHYGNLVGNKTNYRQKLALVRNGAVFSVKSADRIQEVRNK